MAGSSSLEVPPSNFECSLKYDVSDHQSSGANSTGSILGSSVTACKKILCSNSPLESTDYWLQNRRTPCQIGIIDDKLEKNCSSVCFVNLDAYKADYNSDFMNQRLVSVSPNLPKLIASMNVQPLKENEIILLSGLTSGDLQADVEVPQCSWLADVCLLQCARGNRRKNTGCIIFEINKFLIGLELTQEKNLHVEAGILKPEDDTDGSVSSIEEDFLTASEHFGDEEEADEYKNDEENLTTMEDAAEVNKYRRNDFENLHDKTAQLHFTLKGICTCQNTMSCPRTPGSSEEEFNNEGEKNILQTVDKAIKQPHWKAGKCKPSSDMAGKSKPLCNADDQESFFRCNNDNSNRSENTSLTITAKEEVILLDDVTAEQKSHLGISECRAERISHPLIESNKASAGQFATNLAESVLQDAFIRLSQSPSVSEAALGISISSSLTSAEQVEACRSWNVLPKIVIVQSPDCSDNMSEWPGSNLLNLSEGEDSADSADWFQVGSPNGSTQSTLEVALACAASVIGTISSPHTAEKLKDEKSMISTMTGGDHKELEEKSSECIGSNCTSVDYSFPSALSDMTQAASAVAVHGLDEKKDETYPVTSSGLLSAAETSAAITLHCSIAVGSNMENLNNSIAQTLFKEAALVLTKPDTYRTTGDFLESINGKIVQAVKKPSGSLIDEVIVDELAQTLSNAILRHSVEEVRKKQLCSGRNTDTCSESTQDIFIATANKLLFNVLYFTCKKMNDIAQLSERSDIFVEDNLSKQEIDFQPKEASNDVLCQFSSCYNNKPISVVHGTNPDMDVLSKTNLMNNFKGEIVPNELESAVLCVDSLSRVSAHNSPSGKSPPKKKYLKRITKEYHRPVNPNSNQTKAELYSFSGRENLIPDSEYGHGLQEFQTSNVLLTSENHENYMCDAVWHSEGQHNMPLLGGPGYLLPQPLLYLKHPANIYCLADFAEELAETVVSMATEIAAICLDNSDGKQPWFCAWKRGSDYLIPQVLSCRLIKRKKEIQSGGSVVRKHRAPRLSEIKKKTDEHPELKERLMNRVVDDSINFEDTLDLSNNFACEAVTNLAEFSLADNGWQNPNHPRNRLHCDRWSRVNASSCESIPEEDLDSRGSANALALMNTLGQPISRTSSVSKQSSCESITDEFSRFMVNQMESEGREFDLLLDYYAGKNANNILTSALQQVTKKNGHLNVRPSCPSKQSSTESITEEFYRYMLREIDKENKEKIYSARNAREWSNSLLPPSQRSSFSFRQSSVPDSRSSTSRLTVNMPIKANSLDGFSHSAHRDSLSVSPFSTVSSSGLCKSDSYLYQRLRTDQVTDSLIHETWANSIRALMCKNKIIVDDGEVAGPAHQPHSSQPRVQQFANRLASDIFESKRTLIATYQDSTSKDHDTESSHIPVGMENNCKPSGDRIDIDEEEGQASFSGSSSVKHTISSSLREVPLIQIETEQKQDLDNALEPLTEVHISSGKAREHLIKGKPIEADSGQQHLLSSKSPSLTMCGCPESVEIQAMEEFLVPLSSSAESTGSSWCQLENSKDNPGDTTSYLQLSKRSMSNGNSSTSSSFGIMDLEIYQENMPSSHAFNELIEEKIFCKKLPEKREKSISGLSLETAGEQRDLLVINVDLEPECPDTELRVTLQWIAASELGIPTIYFKKTQENRVEKFLDVVQFVHQKSWKVGDIFHAVLQFCKLHEENREMTLSLFDWLLELG